MKQEYIEKIYAGWLAKVIGIRLGAPIEGWTYEKIQNIYGKLDHYPVDYQEFAADDDSNGPLFFLRALEDRKYRRSRLEPGRGSRESGTSADRDQQVQDRRESERSADGDLQAQDVAEALLNYAPYEHGFFWWGGYGISTEHTAYLNLRNGIPAPRSGSIEQNGATMAEQIGGQIFIDTWGLVSPGNPEQAVRYAREAASVTHGGNGIYGGMFVAACISWAFEEHDIRRIIEKGLSYIPADCEYARAVRAVMRFYEEHPENWRACFRYIFENFGYDRYPGNCHIIPNSAVMILALLYGEGDFSRTLNICNMCGWDTDCNVGNVATIMGVRNGLDGIDYEKWRKPVHDFLACSSVVGSLNIMDIPFGATYIAKLAYAVAGEEMPEPWRTIAEQRIDSCHFEYPGSTHTIRIRVDNPGRNVCKDDTRKVAGTDELGEKLCEGRSASETDGAPGKMEACVIPGAMGVSGSDEWACAVHPCEMQNTEEAARAAHPCEVQNTEEVAFTGKRSLKFLAYHVEPGENIYVYRKTYYEPKDFHDSRYDPSFSPLIYPGQVLHGSAYLPEYGSDALVSLYVRDAHSGRIWESGRCELTKGTWKELCFAIPAMDGALLDEMGFCFHIKGETLQSFDFVGMIDDLYADGEPEYSVELAKERTERWAGLHEEISQFTRLKGLMYLEGGQLHLSCADFAEAYTGRHDWKDYTAEFTFTPLTGEHHMVNVRVQGAIRSYAFGLLPGGKAALLKNQNGYTVLAECGFAWKAGTEYTVKVTAKGNQIRAEIDGCRLEATDTGSAYLQGAVGIALQDGSHCSLSRIRIGRA